jgi:hypothetical protein
MQSHPTYSGNPIRDDMICARHDLLNAHVAEVARIKTDPSSTSAQILDAETLLSQLKHSVSSHLIYTCWETLSPDSVPSCSHAPASTSTLAGSHLHELYPATELTAQKMVTDLAGSTTNVDNKHSKYRYVYIPNPPHYWDSACWKAAYNIISRTGAGDHV